MSNENKTLYNTLANLKKGGEVIIQPEQYKPGSIRSICSLVGKLTQRTLITRTNPDQSITITRVK